MAVGCKEGGSPVLAVGNEGMRELFLDSSKLLPHGCNLKGAVTSYSCHGPGFKHSAHWPSSDYIFKS